MKKRTRKGERKGGIRKEAGGQMGISCSVFLGLRPGWHVTEQGFSKLSFKDTVRASCLLDYSLSHSADLRKITQIIT